MIAKLHFFLFCIILSIFLIITTSNVSYSQTVTLTVDNSNIPENSGIATLTATISTTQTEDVTVDLAFSGTATDGGIDYTTTATNIVIPMNATSATLAINTDNDLIDEENETIIVDIANVTCSTCGATEDMTQQVTITISDDDPEPAISVSSPTVIENGSNANFLVSLSEVSGKTITVDYATADNTATAGNDYSSVSTQTLIFNPGDNNLPIMVSLSDDSFDEDDETFFLNLSNATNTSNSTAQGTATINDNDPTPTLSINDLSAGETGTAGFTVTLSAASGRTVTVDYSTANGTATAGTDYTAISTSLLTFNPGVTTRPVSVNILPDALDEANETFFVDLTNASNATISDAQGQATINDDDPPPQIQVNDPVVNESAGTVTFLVTLTSASSNTVTVNYMTANGTAIAGSDYTSASDLVTFTPGDVSENVVISISDDLLDESNETILLNLTSPVNATILDNQGTATINDNDPTPTLSIDNVLAGETGTAGFTVTLSAASGRTVTVEYVTANGTATAGNDYTAISTTLLTFNPGVTTQPVSVNILPDALDEANETFFVDLTNASNATISDPQGQATITDDDPTPVVTLGISPVTQTENGPNVPITATLSAVSGRDVTVNLGFSGTATGGGTDYSAPSNILIPAGAISNAVNISINDDPNDEPDETVEVAISGVTNGIEDGIQTASLTITDNDLPPTVTLGLSGSPFSENGGTSQVSANLSAASSFTVTVNLGFTGTASGSDYSGVTTVLTFTPGDVFESFLLTGIDDNLVESNETIIVDILGVTNGTEAGTEQVTATITSDDNSIITIAQNTGAGNVNLAEPATNGSFRITASNPISTNTTINFENSGPAMLGTEYSSPEGTNFVLPANTTTFDLPFNVVDDSDDEETDTITVRLLSTSNPSVTIPSPPLDSARILILDDDSPVLQSAILPNAFRSNVVLGFSNQMELTDETGFTVLVNSVSQTINSATANGNGIILTLASAINDAAAVIEVQYDGSGNAADDEGNALAAIPLTAVTNNVNNDEVIFLEDFEDPTASDMDYTVVGEFRNNDNQFWRRFNSEDEVSGSGLDNHDFQDDPTLSSPTFYWAGEATDDSGSNPVSITTRQIDVSNFDNFEFVVSVAETGIANYDVGEDFIRFQFRYVGDPTFTSLLEFLPGAPSGSNDLYLDSDLDGSPDFTNDNLLIGNFKEFSAPLPDQNGFIELRVEANTSGVNESFAFDDIIVRGENDNTSPSAFTVSIDPSFVNTLNENTFSFTFSGAEIGTTYNYTISSSGGGPNVTGTGTVASANEQITGIDVSGLGDGTLSLTVTLTDPAGNPPTNATNIPAVTKETNVPDIMSIIRQNPMVNRTLANSVVYRVTFDQDVVNIDPSDFEEAAGGATGTVASVMGVSPNPNSVFDVTINGITGDGLLDLNVAPGNNIEDANGNPFGAVTGTEEIYTIDNTAPITDGVSIVSNNTTNTTQARAGDIITITLDANEEIASGSVIATVQSGGDAMTNSPEVNTTGDPSLVTITIEVAGADTDGAVSFTIDYTDFVGNPAIQVSGVTDGSTVTVDNTTPEVSSINVVPVFLTGIGSSNGTISNSVEFTVTFTEAVTGVDASDFSLIQTDAVTGGIISVVSGFADTYTVTVNSYTGTGELGLDFGSNGSVIDVAGNSTIQNFTTGQQYSIVLPEPVLQPTGFAFNDRTSSSVFIDFTEPNTPMGQQHPTAYVITATDPGGTPGAPPPVDGVRLFNETNFSDNVGSLIVDAVAPNTSGTVEFTGLPSGTNFTFEIFSYALSSNNSDDNINYLITGAPSFVNFTNTAQSSTLTNGPSTAPLTISSLTNDLVSAPVVFDFTIADDANTAADGDDTSPIKLDQITIRPGTGNTITNWINAIAGAELSSGGQTQLLNPASDVGTNTLLFENIDVTDPSGLGFIPDNGTKTYELKVWLRNPLGGTLATSIDNRRLAFSLSEDDIVLDNTGQVSSRIISGQSASSESDRNQVEVEATVLNYTTLPQSSIGLGASFSPIPVVEAQDANGNRDLDFAQPVNLTLNGDSLTFVNGPTSFPAAPNGVLTFPANFAFTSSGSAQLVVNSSGVTSATSAVVNVLVTNLTSITAGSFTEPASISSTIDEVAEAVNVFDFVITDDVGATGADNDIVPTRINAITIIAGGSDEVAAASSAGWSDALLYAALTDGIATIVGSINTNNIVFNGFAFDSPGEFGFVPDGGNKTYTLEIALDPNMPSALKEVIDNLDFEFEITDAGVSVQAGDLSSKLIKPQMVASGADNLTVDVLATQLVFNPGTVPATANYDIDLSSTPVLTARDDNDLRDRDYNATVTITNAGNVNLQNFLDGDLTKDAGQYTFNANFRYLSTGPNAVNNADGTLTVSDGSLIDAVSTPVNVVYAGTSDIVRNTSFSYSENIAYVGEATLDPTNTILESFRLRDGGASNDIDGTPTILQTLTLRVTNWENIAQLGLYDGATLLSQSAVTGELVTFNNIGFQADDDSDDFFDVRAGFNTNVDDNEVITFEVTFAEAAALGSSQFGASDAGGASSSVSGDDNRIEVNTDRLIFTQSPVSPSTETDLVPSPVVEAQDGNGNLDVDYNGTVTNISVIGTVTPAFNNPGANLNFTNGIYDFGVKSADFQFTEDSEGNSDIQLVVEGTNGPIGAVSDAVSDPFEISSAEESQISYLTGSSTENVAYINFTETDLNSSSFVLGTYRLFDGGETDNLDFDGASTRIESIDFSVSNHTYLNRIALYDGATELAEQDAAATVSFAGLNFVATDDSFNDLIVRVSFITTVDDNQQIGLTITDIQSGGGSQFLSSNPVVNASTPTNGDFNRIEVAGTQYVFNPQPDAFTGIGFTFTTNPTVSVEDANNNRDLDFNETVTISTQDGISGFTSATFDQGFLDINNDIPGVSSDGFYFDAGNGTLTLGAAASVAANSSSNVEVFNVEVSQIGQDASGIASGAERINSNATNVPILGFRFQSQHTPLPDEPELNEIIIDFGVDITQIIDTLRLFSSNDQVFIQSDDNPVLAFEARVNPANSEQYVISDIQDEDFGSTSAQRNYFLVANILNTVNENTSPITPTLVVDTSRIEFSAGSVTGMDVVGESYEFIDQDPPGILTFSPVQGANNVDTSAVIRITFDEGIRILPETQNIDPIVLRNGFLFDGNEFEQVPAAISLDADGRTILIDPLISLPPDTSFFVNIPAPSIEDSVGVTDLTLNAFEGITNTIGYRFRTRDITPPVFPVLSPFPSGGLAAGEIVNPFEEAFDLRVLLNEVGTVYYVIVEGDVSGAPPSTFEEIRNGTYPGSIQSGSIAITEPEVYHYESITGLGGGPQYTAWFIAEDDGGLEMEVTGAISAVGNTQTGFGNEIQIEPVALELCQGGFKDILLPIHIEEGDVNDISGSGTFTYSIGLPVGYAFDTDDNNTIVTALAGRDVSVIDWEFVNSQTFRFSYTVSGNSNRDRITIEGLEVAAQIGAQNGNIVRVGGTAIMEGNTEADALVHAALTTFERIDPTFTVSAVEGDNLNTITPDQEIFGDEIESILLLPNPVLEDGENTFSGTGVTTGANGSIFSPLLAGVGEYDVTISHTDEFGCISQQTRNFEVIDADQAIVGLEAAYCVNNDTVRIPIRPTSVARRLISLEASDQDQENPEVLTIQFDSTVTSLLDENFFFVPEEIAEAVALTDNNLKSFDFTAVYIDLETGDTLDPTPPIPVVFNGLVTELLSIEYQTPNTGISATREYCSTEPFIQLQGQIEAGGLGFLEREFFVDTLVFPPAQFPTLLTNTGNGQARIQPPMPSISERDTIPVFFNYTDLNGCTATITDTVFLNPFPRPDFVVEGNSCVGQQVTLREVTFVGLDPGDEVVTRRWSIQDGPSETDEEDEFFEFTPEDFGVREVTLEVETAKGCISAITTNTIPVGAIPEPVASWFNVCEGSNTGFAGSSTSSLNTGESFSFTWDYGDGSSRETGDTVFHEYANPGDYTATLVVETDLTGCSDSIVRTITIYDVISPTAQNEYLANFESGLDGWRMDSTRNENRFSGAGNVNEPSWVYGSVPDEASFAGQIAEGNNLWFTGVNGYSDNENSFVNSPCFNLTGLTRPMIEMDTWIETAIPDGAVLEYTTDGQEWVVLGSVNEEGRSTGINWYNRDDINSVPGAQTDERLGWSKQARLDLNDEIDTTYFQVRHQLDDIPSPTSVQFRIAFASQGNNDTDLGGFAFDNVRIRSRERMVFLEQFVNANLTDAQDVLSQRLEDLRNAVNEDFITITYHTEIPDPDEINERNSADPNARRAFYGHEVIPASSIDGIDDAGTDGYVGNSLNGNNLAFDDLNIILRSLRDPEFDITVNYDGATADNELSVGATVTPRNDMTETDNIRAYIAVVEKTNGQNQNVLRTFLPDAGGFVLGDTLSGGESITIENQIWSVSNIMSDTLSVVVFVQRQDETQEVLQSILFEVPDIKSQITAAADVFDSERIVLYPNPANESVNIEIDISSVNRVTWQLYSQGGNIMEAGASTAANFRIRTADLPGGLYLLAIETDKGDVLYHKILVAHD